VAAGSAVDRLGVVEREGAGKRPKSKPKGKSLFGAGSNWKWVLKANQKAKGNGQRAKVRCVTD